MRSGLQRPQCRALASPEPYLPRSGRGASAALHSSDMATATMKPTSTASVGCGRVWPFREGLPPSSPTSVVVRDDALPRLPAWDRCSPSSI